MGEVINYSAEGGMLAARLETIENRLHDNMNRIAESMIDIGRCLNQAKDEKLVPHGQWAAWVQQHTGFNTRTAQRYMEVAREIPSTSPLAGLEFSKVHALLALPAADREAFAEEVDAESKSVRELKKAIEARQVAEREREEEQNRRIEIENAMRLKESQAARERDKLMRELEEAQKGGAARAEIERLQAEIEEQEEEIIRRANAEAKIKHELLALQKQVARGDVGGAAPTSEIPTPEELGEMVKPFILGRAAVIPHMGAELSTCDGLTRAAYRSSIEKMLNWCNKALQAVDTIAGEVIVG